MDPWFWIPTNALGAVSRQTMTTDGKATIERLKRKLLASFQRVPAPIPKPTRYEQDELLALLHPGWEPPVLTAEEADELNRRYGKK